MRRAQDQDEYTPHIKQALQQYEKGEAQTHSDAEWARDNESNCVIQEGVLKKAWVKGKGQTASTVWQTVVPSCLRANTIQEFHTSLRNAYYGDLKTYTQIREHYTWNAMYSKVQECTLKEASAPRASWWVSGLHM